jgi:hypothetical protein
LDDSVLGRLEVLRGVPARRTVAAAHVAAAHAEPQVDPAASLGETLLAQILVIFGSSPASPSNARVMHLAIPDRE